MRRLLYVCASLAATLALYAGQTAYIGQSPLHSAAPAAAGAAPSTNGGDYKIVKVVDGDTVDVEKNGQKMRLRLIGLDTPEIVDLRKPVQCFAKEASDKARQILTGQTVRLEMDPTQGELDKYGRTLAYIFVPANSTIEGILFNEYMIAEGFGHEYTYRLPYKYMEEFKAAEKSARENKKGLWADGVCG